MNIDVENKINNLILQEQSWQEQLISVQMQKTRLQTVLDVWQQCSRDPQFYSYVASVMADFKTMVPEPQATEPTAQTTNTTSEPVAMDTTMTTENTTTTVDPAIVQ